MENKENSGRTNSTRTETSRANSRKANNTKGGNAKMNSNEKRWVILLVAVLVIAVVLIVGLSMGKNKQEQAQGAQMQSGTSMQQGNNGDNGNASPRVNTNEGFNATKTYNNLEISNIQLSEANGSTVLLADVTNKGDSTHEQETVKITIVGEDDSEITVNAIIGTIEPGETIKLNTSLSADVVNARDFKIEAGE